MDKLLNDQILVRSEKWFTDIISGNHQRALEKCKNPDIYNINPFLIRYLAAFIDGQVTSESFAKALIYPRILGTSITTSFGQNLQKFITSVFPAMGSLIPGIDIEFADALDGEKKYCQVKAGPNTINKDDVETINNHFKSAKNIGVTNNVSFTSNSFFVGVLYGTHGDLNANYKRLEKDYFYPVYAGKEFWHRLTGDQAFYDRLIDRVNDRLIDQFAKEASSTDASTTLNITVRELASNLEKRYPGWFLTGSR